MIQKVIGTLLLIAAVYLGLQGQRLDLLTDIGSFSAEHSSTSETLETPLSQAINEDLRELQKKGKLPKAWSKIQGVNYIFNSDESKALFGTKKIPVIQEKGNGRFVLEMEFIELPDEKAPAVIVQMSLVEKKSGNKIWELGRTYPIQKEKTLPSTSKNSNDSK